MRISDLYMEARKTHFVCRTCLRKAEVAPYRALWFTIWFMIFLSLIYCLWGEGGR